jgi:hypothetical protein
MRTDAAAVADRLRWAVEWVKAEQPPDDLPDLMLRAAAALERSASKHWRTIAAIEAVVLVVVACLIGGAR